MKKLILIHNIGLCKHKTFFGMQDGHCIKCGKAYKNCEVCFPTPPKGQKKKQDIVDRLIYLFKDLRKSCKTTNQILIDSKFDYIQGFLEGIKDWEIYDKK